jgi:arginine repressor
MSKADIDDLWEDEMDGDEDVEKLLHDAAEEADQDAKNAPKIQASRGHAVDDDDDDDDDDEDEDAYDDDDADEYDDDETDSDTSAKSTINKKDSKMTGKSGGKTKAEAIRAVIAARKAAGQELRPKDIIETLRDSGIEVNASQVSITLRAMGVPALRRGPASGSKSAKDSGSEKARALPKMRAMLASDSTPAGLLKIAQEFINIAGGHGPAKALLNKIVAAESDPADAE